MRKAPGPDDITTEMLVAAGGRGVTEITNLANMMYSEGRFPEQMYKSIFITVPKVKGTAKCEKHRTLSLMSHVTKLVLRVIMNRIRGRTLSEISEVLYGFMPDRGTIRYKVVEESEAKGLFLNIATHSLWCSRSLKWGIHVRSQSMVTP